MNVNKEMTGVDKKYFAIFNGAEGEDALSILTTKLFEKQKEEWTALADGHAMLQKALVREIDGGSWRGLIQCNPGRIVSSGAKIDPESLKNRPCFLCPDNLPARQQTILYRSNFNILCNPAPIFPGHLTVAAIRHVPQSLLGNVASLLLLAEDFGPGSTVFYNGPRAGASAPDHLHFHVVPRGVMPIEKEVLIQGREAEKKDVNGAKIFRTKGLVRGVLVVRADRVSAVVSAIERIVGVLGRSTLSEEEPMLNLFCSFSEGGWQLLLFPRLKHRPDAFFREGEGQLLVSPGSADMGGVVSAPREKDFHVLTAASIAEIYREVAFDDVMIGELFSEL